MLTVRPARQGDAGALRAIAAAAYRGYVPRIGRPPAPMTANYGQVISDADVWVAGTDGGIVGFLVLIARADHLLLENIAVLPAAQGSGVGARLLRHAEDRARALGIGEIRLYTNEAMTENLAYYPRHGYVETHRAEQGGFQRVFFGKRLGSQ